MTKNESVGLYQALNQLGSLKGVKFAYAVSKNLSILKPDIESLEKAITPTPEYSEFEKLRIAMVEKFAKKNEKGEFEKKGNNYQIEDGKQGELDAEFEALKKEHQEVFDARFNQVEEYNKLLSTDSTVVLYKVALADVPSDISVNQMYSIKEIVEESVPSPYNK